MSQSDMRTITRAVTANGYRIVSAGKHKKILTGDGKPVVDEDGPVTIATTPSDSRWRDNTVTRLVRTGVLAHDPFSPPSPSGPVAHIASPEMQALKIAAIKERSRENQRETQKLRERVLPIINKLGNWESPKFMHELTQVMLHYGVTHEIQPWFNTRGETSHGSVGQSLRNLRTGNTIHAANRGAIEHFFEELETAPDLHERWFELVREAKGLPQKQEAAVLLPLHVPETVYPETIEEALAEPLLPEEPAAEPLHDLARVAPQPVIPSLALEALFEMTHGKEVVDKDHVLAIAAKIAELEMR